MPGACEPIKSLGLRRGTRYFTGMTVSSTPRVLFICTGNFYRSRWAEALFNFEAERQNLAWRAFSRGLATWYITEGTLSPDTARALVEREIPERYAAGGPTQLGEADLLNAQRIIALKKDEHHRFMIEQFPRWANAIEYWDVHDIDVARPDEAIPQIERYVHSLLEEIIEGVEDPGQA
jgi:protein-tyrosine phosphatase